MHGGQLLPAIDRDGELFLLRRQQLVHVAGTVYFLPVDVRYNIARLKATAGEKQCKRTVKSFVSFSAVPDSWLATCAPAILG